MINIAINPNAVSQLFRELLSNKSSDRVDRRTYNRRGMSRRSSGQNERVRFLLDIRTAVYKETRKGDLEVIDLRPSVFHALQKAVNRPMSEWGFIDRYTGKVAQCHEVTENGLDKLHRVLDADQRMVARVGDMVDTLVNTIWSQYVVSAHDRRVDERRHAATPVNFRPTTNCLPDPLTA